MKSVLLSNYLQDNHKCSTKDRHYGLMDLLCYDQTVSQEKKGCCYPKWHPHYNRACCSDFLRHFTPPVFSSAIVLTIAKDISRDVASNGISPAVYSILMPATEATQIRRTRRRPRVAPPGVRSDRRTMQQAVPGGGRRAGDH